LIHEVRIDSCDIKDNCRWIDNSIKISNENGILSMELDDGRVIGVNFDDVERAWLAVEEQ